MCSLFWYDLMGKLERSTFQQLASNEHSDRFRGKKLRLCNWRKYFEGVNRKCQLLSTILLFTVVRLAGIAYFPFFPFFEPEFKTHSGLPTKETLYHHDHMTCCLLPQLDTYCRNCSVDVEKTLTEIDFTSLLSFSEILHYPKNFLFITWVFFS